MSMEGANGAIYDPEFDVRQEVSTNGSIDPLADRYWDPTAIAAEDLVEMSLSVEEAAWAVRQATRVRLAGARATWEGRRNIQGRYTEREPGFVGRYDGGAKIIPRLIAAAEGPEIIAVLP